MGTSLTPLGAVIAQWIFWLAALAFVLLRLWVRWYLQNRLSLSDALIVVSMICMTYSHCADTVLEVWIFMDPAPPATPPPPPANSTLLASGTNGTSTSSGSGTVLNLNPGQIERLHHTIIAFKMIYFSVPAYYSTTWCIKAAFVLFYYQLFPPRMRKLRMALHATAFLVFTSWITILFLNFFWCLPVSRNWDYAHPENVCLSYDSHEPYYTTVAFHLLTDVLVYALPFFLLPFLSLSFRKKVSLSIVFGLGLLCILVAVARVIALAIGADLSIATVVSAAEQAIAVIVACCPPLKWLWVSYKSSLRGGSTTMSIEEGGFAAAKKVGDSDTNVEEFGTLRVSTRRSSRTRTANGTDGTLGATTTTTTTTSSGLGMMRGGDRENFGSEKIGCGASALRDTDTSTKMLGNVTEEPEVSTSPPPNRNRSGETGKTFDERNNFDIEQLDVQSGGEDNFFSNHRVEIRDERELTSQKSSEELATRLSSPYRRRS